MPSILFHQEYFFRDAGRCVHSSVSLNKRSCALNNIQHLTALDNNISTESILKQFTSTFHLLICETQWVQFL